MALRLHDVDDAAHFVGAIVTRSGLELSYHDREDLQQHLTIECWQLSLDYDGSRGSRFSAYAGAVLKKRVVDWQRKRHGRRVWKFKTHTYVRPHVELVSLDAERDSLGETLAADGGDPATVWDEAGGGLLEERDRHRVQDLDCLDLKEAR